MSDIFLSHNSKDKAIVEPIAIKLAQLYGEEHVFYDSWSIQPGESIIGRMNDGLSQVSFFFYFVSNNSINSKMVNLEWQSALMKSLNAGCKFIAIKMDDCVIPQIIAQNKYLDLNNYGVDVVLQQMITIIEEGKVGSELVDRFSNLICEVKRISNKELSVEIRAIHFQEPISHYLFLFDNKKDEVVFESTTDHFFASSQRDDVFYKNKNEFFTAASISLMRATVPGFPIRFTFKTNNGTKLNYIAVLKYENEHKVVAIPEC